MMVNALKFGVRGRCRDVSLMKRHSLMPLMAFVACSSSAQVEPTAPSFEVASVKRADSNTGAGTVSPSGLKRTGAAKLTSGPGRLTYSNATLKTLVSVAYEIDADQVSGPSWLDTEKYDVVAILPTGTQKQQIPGMWKTLLASRFHAVVHTEVKSRKFYALVVGNGGPKLRAAREGGDPADLTFEDNRVQIKGATMPGFARILSSFLGRPVQDMTGLPGIFDLSLGIPISDLMPAKHEDPLTAGGGSVFGAVKDLGLKLEPRSEDAKFVVVDKADRVPAEN